MMRDRRYAIALGALLASAALATPAQAQVDPLYRNWDENGVDVVRGDFQLFFNEASIGSGRARLDLVREKGDINQPYQWDNRKLFRTGTGTITTRARKLDDTYFRFTGSTSDAGDGATITTSTDFTEIKDSSGVIWRYSNPLTIDGGVQTNICSTSIPSPCELPLSSIAYPDGTVITILNGTWRNTITKIVSTRVVRVSNSFGYDFNFTYPPSPFHP